MNFEISGLWTQIQKFAHIISKIPSIKAISKGNTKEW